MKTEDCQGRGDRQSDRETELSPEISQLGSSPGLVTAGCWTLISGSISLLLVINKENSHHGFVQSHSSLIKPREGSFIFCLFPF